MTEDELKKAIADFIAQHAEQWRTEERQLENDRQKCRLEQFKEEHRQELMEKWQKEDAYLADLFEQKARELLD